MIRINMNNQYHTPYQYFSLLDMIWMSPTHGDTLFLNSSFHGQLLSFISYTLEHNQLKGNYSDPEHEMWRSKAVNSNTFKFFRRIAYFTLQIPKSNCENGFGLDMLIGLHKLI